MSTNTIDVLLNHRWNKEGDSHIYIIHEGQTDYYVGESNAISGIRGRLLHHLQIIGTGSDEGVIVTAPTNLAQALKSKFGMSARECKSAPDGRAMFRLSIDILDQAAVSRRELGFRWYSEKIGSMIGCHILDHIPQSRSWEVDLLSTTECREWIIRRLKDKDPYRYINETLSIDEAEYSMIRHRLPRLNDQYMPRTRAKVRT